MTTTNVAAAVETSVADVAGESTTGVRRVWALLEDPTASPAANRARLRFAGMLVGIGVLHFVAPGPFRRIVPRWFPWREQAVLWSGVAEVASGALVAVPQTQRAGGWLAFGTIAAVYPANIQMTIDAARGNPQVPGPAWLTWVRLPMQVPMLVQAWRLTRSS